MSLSLPSLVRPYVEFDFRRMALDSRVTYTRSTDMTYFGADGLMHIAPPNVAPLEYDPVTGLLLGRSFWEARTNLCVRSTDFAHASWVKSSTGVGLAPVVTPGTSVAPDGTTTMALVTLDRNAGTTTSDWSWLYFNATSTGGIAYTTSVWLQAATPSDVGKVVRISGAGGGGKLVSLKASPERVSYTNAPAGTGAQSHGIRLRGAEGTAAQASLYVWGAQIEAGSSASSYIPTAGAAVTRAATVASFAVPPGVVRLVTTYADSTETTQAVTPGATYTIPHGTKVIRHIRGYKS